MKHLLLFPFLSLPLVAQLRITEVMSSSDHSTGSANGDWFEITNTGTSAINLNGYSFDDSGPTPKQPGQIFPSHSIAAGNSIIVLRESSAASFRSLWSIPASVKIFTEADVPNFPGLGSDGDSVFLFNNSFSVVDVFTFGPAISGASFARFTNGNSVPGGLSVDGLFGSYLSNDSSEDVGSPGFAAQPPSPLPPVFIAPFSTAWISDRKLSDSEFRISSLDPNPGDIVTLTAVSKPAWLTFTDLGSGIGQLGGIPTVAEVGTHEIVVQAADNSGTTTPSTQTYKITIAPGSSPVILNEYNAVQSDNFLNGGTAAIDSDEGPAANDSHFGRVAGNGGDWFELVVVGNGMAGKTNLLNWTIEIGKPDSTDIFSPLTIVTLSDPAVWSSVGNGTILTFIEKNSAAGGLDSEVNRVNELTTTGYAWSNFHLGTPSFISVSNLAELDIDSNNTQFVIKDAGGKIVFGPAGEGVSPLSGISGSEIFELENDPSPLIPTTDRDSNTTLGYDDGSSGSTFGSPNLFQPSGGTVAVRSQDFTPYIAVSSPFQDYLVSVGLSGSDEGTDSDQDGYSNLDEYLFGGNPNNATLTPSTTFVIGVDGLLLSGSVRVSDPAYPVIAERSDDLQIWVSDDLTIEDSASDLGANFVKRTVTFIGTPERVFLRLSTPTEE